MPLTESILQSELLSELASSGITDAKIEYVSSENLRLGMRWNDTQYTAFKHDWFEESASYMPEVLQNLSSKYDFLTPGVTNIGEFLLVPTITGNCKAFDCIKYTSINDIETTPLVKGIFTKMRQLDDDIIDNSEASQLIENTWSDVVENHPHTENIKSNNVNIIPRPIFITSNDLTVNDTGDWTLNIITCAQPTAQVGLGGILMVGDSYIGEEYYPTLPNITTALAKSADYIMSNNIEDAANTVLVLYRDLLGVEQISHLNI